MTTKKKNEEMIEEAMVASTPVEESTDIAQPTEDTPSTPVEESMDIVQPTEDTPSTPAINLSVFHEEGDASTPNKVLGIVANCDSLNVRLEPSIEAEIVSILRDGDEVIIIQDQSTETFYKVNTAAGVAGYCMTTYIALQN